MKNKKGQSGKSWILKNSKGQHWKVVILSALCMVSAALGVYFALLLRNVVDCAVKGEKEKFIHVALVTSVLILFQIIIGYLIRYLDERSRADLENNMKKNVWARIMTRDYQSLESYHTGELMNRLSNDVKVVADNIVTLVPNMVSMVTKLVCAIGILLFLDWRFTVIFIAGGAAVMGFSVIFRKKMKLLHKEMQQAEGQVRSFQQEMIESLLVIRSFQAEKKVENMGSAYMEEHKTMRLRKNIFSNMSQTGFSVIMNVGYLFGIFWCGLGILQGTLSYGTLLAVQQLIGQVQQPIAGMAGFIPRYYAMVASAERLVELEELPGDDVDSQESAVNTVNKILVKKVTTGYKESSENVLEEGTITVESGDILAVTGESGTGKSTFLKMLLCIYPLRTGSVVIQDKSGQEYSLNKSGRQLFAYVPQGNFLMSGTIREVVSFYGMKGCMTVEKACSLACADGYIENLPEGYDTKLGERGVGLSEGQLQRLAIARALYMGAPVLLLDEATSALDEKTEVKVLENIKGLKNKTVIIVTHRPAALKICTRVIEIREKKLVEK